MVLQHCQRFGFMRGDGAADGSSASSLAIRSRTAGTNACI